MAIQATARRPVRFTPGSLRERHVRLRAPFSLRCGAILIDYVILISILALSTLVARMLGGGARSAGSSSETLGILMMLIVAFLDLGLFPGLKGLTIGKWATGLRIERPGETEVGIGRAMLRHFVGYPLSLLTLGLGFLVAAVNARGLTLHDVIAGTVVVRDVPTFTETN
ncbi:MAG TPA: RDD family protein [Pyrinomonadaceae bacterium]|nr:RDD family protein [Pyrinomonadaceae bacterium]